MSGLFGGSKKVEKTPEQEASEESLEAQEKAAEEEKKKEIRKLNASAIARKGLGYKGLMSGDVGGTGSQNTVGFDTISPFDPDRQVSKSKLGPNRSPTKSFGLMNQVY